MVTIKWSVTPGPNVSRMWRRRTFQLAVLLLIVNMRVFLSVCEPIAREPIGSYTELSRDIRYEEHTGGFLALLNNILII